MPPPTRTHSLSPGGRFVIELWIPAIRGFPDGQAAAPFHVGAERVGFDTYDMATQRGTSHHYTHESEGSVRYGQTTSATSGRRSAT